MDVFQNERVQNVHVAILNLYQFLNKNFMQEMRVENCHMQYSNLYKKSDCLLDWLSLQQLLGTTANY